MKDAQNRYNRHDRIRATRIQQATRLEELTGQSAATIYEWMRRENIGTVTTADDIRALERADAFRATINELGG